MTTGNNKHFEQVVGVVVENFQMFERGRVEWIEGEGSVRAAPADVLTDGRRYGAQGMGDVDGSALGDQQRFHLSAISQRQTNEAISKQFSVPFDR